MLVFANKPTGHFRNTRHEYLARYLFVILEKEKCRHHLTDNSLIFKMAYYDEPSGKITYLSLHTDFFKLSHAD